VPGDEVYAFAQGGRPIDLNAEVGFCSQYGVAPESCVLTKPKHLSHEDAASLPGFTLTAYQAIETALRLMRENGVTDGREWMSFLL
jgi:NADPH:quinone reductase-like Zn-dependent oxidoreductase